MKLIQSFKIILLIAIMLCFVFPAIKPNGKETAITLITKAKKDSNRERQYHLIDDDGLTYTYEDFKKSGFKKGDLINLQVMSRTYMASNSNKRKKYQFDLSITNNKSQNKQPFLLTYNKKPSKVISKKVKKGFYFSEAGYWFRKIKLTKYTIININPRIKKGHEVYIRLLANKQDLKELANKVNPINYQKKISIKYNDGEKRFGWYLVNQNKEQQFMLKENKIYRVETRLVLDDNSNDSLEANLEFNLQIDENGYFAGNYLFDGISSVREAIILTDVLDLKSRRLSRSNKFFITVPQSNEKDKDYSNYTFRTKDDQQIIIRLVEYDK